MLPIHYLHIYAISIEHSIVLFCIYKGAAEKKIFSHDDIKKNECDDVKQIINFWNVLHVAAIKDC